MSVPTFSIKIITLVYSSDPKHIPHLFPIPFQREGMELSGCTDNYSRNGNISYIHGLEASDGRGSRNGKIVFRLVHAPST